MLFNSITFLVFATVVVLVNFIIKPKYRWLFLLSASYFFYMSWSPAYAILIAFTTAISYWVGLNLNSENTKRNSLFLQLSFLINLGVLFFFKYFNFLNDLIKEFMVWSIELSYEFNGFDILLPIGISFYTLQVLSYNIDVYYGKKEAETHLGIFALFVSFFPQLIAGPIERSTSLIPQFKKATSFNWDRFNTGLQYIIWGFFKKVVIADRLSIYVNQIFDNSSSYHSGLLILGAILFTFQLYCDFSAYSEIAKGVAKILGYDLMENFNHPFISKNITEFWRRWHISLSTWLRDYLFTPLVFKHKAWGRNAVLYSIFVTFLLCGLWHGARLTYIFFGFLQGLALMYELMTRNFRKKIRSKMNTRIYEYTSMLITISFVFLSCIFFRSDNLAQAWDICHSIFSFHLRLDEIRSLLSIPFLLVILLLTAFILSEKAIFSVVKGEREIPPLKQQFLFGGITALIIIFGFYDQIEFVYFQF